MKKQLLVSVLIVIIVSPFSYWAIKYANNRSKENAQSELLTLTEISKFSVDLEEFQRLSGTEKDINSPDYIRLREQFKLMGEQLKKRGIYGVYVVKKINNDIIFIADSAPQGDPWHADIGIKYEDPPKELLDVFVKGKTLSTDKYTDEFGTFFSTFVPIFNRDGTDIVAVMAADIDYNEFIKKTDGQTRTIIYVILLLVALTLMIYFLIDRINQGRINQKKHNEQLTSTNNSLEKTVKERTAELEKINSSLEKIVKERTAEIEKKVLELEKINALMTGRELKMIELKKEIEVLKKKLGEPNS